MRTGAKVGMARLGLLLCVVAALLALPASASALTDADELGRFGSEGEGAGQLSFPGSSAADPKTGHLYVEGFNRRIDEFTPWGEFVKAVGWDVAPGAVNEQQEIRVRAGAGTFKLSFGASTTPDLPFDATAVEVQSALNGLSSIGGAGASVSVEEQIGKAATATPFVYVVAFKGSLAGTDVTQLSAANGSDPLGAGNPKTELEVRTRADGTPGGTGLEACTEESGCQIGSRGEGTGQVSFVKALAVDSAGDLYVGERADGNGIHTRVQKFDPAGRFLLMFGGDTIVDGAAGTGSVTSGSTAVTSVVTAEKAFRVGQVIEGTGIEAGTKIAEAGNGTIILSAPAGPAATGTTTALSVKAGPNNIPSNEKQTVKLGANTTGGSFTLSFSTSAPSPSSTTTAPIPYNATALELEEKLAVLTNVGAGNVAVTGSTGGPWTVEFKGARYTDTDVEQMGVNAGGLAVSEGEKTVTVTSVKGAEICRIAVECQAPERGSGPGQFSQDPNLDTAPDGTLLVGSTQRVQRFNLEGEYLSEIEVPRGGSDLAVDPESGDLWLVSKVGQTFSDPSTVSRLDAASGKELSSFEVPKPTVSGLTTDPSGNLFLRQDRTVGELEKPEHDQRVLEFDRDGNPVSILAEAEPIPGGNFGGQNWRLEGFGTNALGDLYISNHEGSNQKGAFIRFFGPPPVSFESPPRRAPRIGAQYAVSVGSGEAELRARINPRFWNDSSYHVEYGTSPCTEGGCTDTAEANLTHKVIGGLVTSPGVLLEGLQAGTVYHYRFVAKSTGGGPVYGVDPDGEGPAEASIADGVEGTFVTFRPSEPPACPENEAFHSGLSALLPDCRAYEMVSPVDKEGGDIVVLPETTTQTPSVLAQSSEDGVRLAYGSVRSFGDAVSAPLTTQYVAAREAGKAWATHGISAPHGKTVYQNALVKIDAEIRAFSPNLCEAWFQSYAELPTELEPLAPPGVTNLFRRSDEECGGPTYEALNTVDPPNVSEDAFSMELQGLSEDGSTAVFLANDALADGASPAIPGPDNANSGPMQLYIAQGGQERFVCVLPGGGNWPGSCTAGGNTSTAGNRSREANVTGALSADGERVYWTAARGGAAPIYLRENPTQDQSALAHGAATGTGKLTEGSTAITSLVAARGKASITAGSPIATLIEAPSVGEFVAGQPLNPTTGISAGTTVVKVEGKTLTLSTNATATSPSVTLASAGPMPFAIGQTIGASGIPAETTITAVKAGELKISKAATVTQAGAQLNATSECTEPEKACTIAVSQQAEGETGAGGSQYWAAAADGSKALFTTAGKLYEFRLADRSTHLIAGEVVGMMGQSADASRVYLASKEAKGGPNAEGRAAVSGKPNLYFYEAGQFRFIGALVEGNINFSSIEPLPFKHTARVDADGLHAAFKSAAPLTGYDNTDVSSEQPDAEVFLYDASGNGGEGKLVCASCNPSGARPNGAFDKAQGAQTAAQIPAFQNILYASRVLSEDGSRLYFESYDALTPRDTNGAKDVYQWEAPGTGGCGEGSISFSPLNGGCVDLISSGKSTRGSDFVDASPSGDDVFFTTLSSLLPQDPGLVDIYDARVNGGLPGPQTPPPSCEGEACQSAPEAPSDPTPSSESFEGAGNVSEGAPPARRPCAKGRVKRHGKCVARKHKRAHKRRANHGRRAER